MQEVLTEHTASYSGYLLFPHLTDEPESKKLAAQADLDSAKALCEFIPLFYTLFTPLLCL